MLIEEGLVSHLRDLAVVEERIYPQVLPAGTTLPAIAYQVISEEHHHTTEGKAGLARKVFQLSVWAETNDDGHAYAQAKSIAESLRVALDGFRGELGTVRAHSVLHVGGRDLYSNDAGTSGVSLDFAVAYEESR